MSKELTTKVISGKMQQSRFWKCHPQKEMVGLAVRMVTLFQPKMLILRHRRVLFSFIITTCKCQTGCKNKRCACKKMKFSVVMLAFAEKVKTEIFLRQQ